MTWTFLGAITQSASNRLYNIEPYSASGGQEQVEVSMEDTTFESGL